MYFISRIQHADVILLIQNTKKYKIENKNRIKQAFIKMSKKNNRCTNLIKAWDKNYWILKMIQEPIIAEGIFNYQNSLQIIKY